MKWESLIMKKEKRKCLLQKGDSDCLIVACVTYVSHNKCLLAIVSESTDPQKLPENHWLMVATVSVILLQSTSDNSNLQGKSKNVRVIGSSKKIAGSKEKNNFY